MNIFVWGMGLIGASLALRLKEKGFAVSGAVRSKKSQGELKRMGFDDVYIDRDEALNALDKADILALGLNINDCYAVLDNVLADATRRKKLIIFDMCSTKSEICAFMRTRYSDVKFVGAHPMAGKEVLGPQAAESALFEGASVYIAPSAASAATEQVVNIWQICGAQTAEVDPEVHDRIMASVSHGLHLVACLIAEKSVENGADRLPLSPAAGSYRDMTRIALSSGQMWKEISESNKTNVARWLREFSHSAERLADELDTGTADIVALFERAQAARQKLMRT